MSFKAHEIFAALNDVDARYLVVGGFAVILHGYMRSTVDVDLVVELDADNCRRALKALHSIGLRPRLPIDLMDFADAEKRRVWFEERNMLVLQLWDPTNPFRSVDLFVREPFAFEEMWQTSIRKTVAGVVTPVVSREHLVAMKRAAGRGIDLDDIEALSHIAQQSADNTR